jgi:hypothetical protein
MDTTNRGGKDVFYGVNNIHCYAVLLKASYDNVLLPPEAKVSNIFHVHSMASDRGSNINFKRQDSC